MKLVIATGIYPPEIGGPAGYVRGLATELVKRGHQVAVVTYGDERTEAGRGFEVTVVPRTGGPLVRYGRYMSAVRRLARKSDLVYIQGPVSEGLPGLVGAKLARKPVVLKIVGDFAWEQYMQSPLAETKPESLDEFLEHRHQGKIRSYEIVERWVAKRADRIIVASNYMKSAIMRWNIAHDKIEVIHNAIDLERVAGERADIRQELGLPTDAKLALVAGRIIYWKRLDVALRALSRLDSSWRLLLAGDGPMEEKWKQLTDELGLHDRVTWLGRIERRKLWQYMAAADVFLVPSSLETFSFVLLEALAQGSRAVISDRGGMLEIAARYPELVSVCAYEDDAAMADAMATKFQGSRAQPIDLKDFSETVMVDRTLEALTQTI